MKHRGVSMSRFGRMRRMQGREQRRKQRRKASDYHLWPLTVAAFVLVVSVGSTPPLMAADLLSVYQQAIENDARLASQRFRYRADQQRIVQSRSSFRPQVGFNGNYGVGRNEVSTPEAGRNSSTDDFDNLNFSVSQSLFDRAAKATIEQSKDEVRLSALQLNDTRQDVALRVSVAYFNSLAAQDNLEVARSEMSAISRQLDLAREMLEVGLGTKTDLFDTEARFKLAEVSEIEALNEIEDSIRSLEEITGLSPGELATLSDSAPVSSPEPPELEFWLTLGASRSLSVLQGDQTATVARRQIEVNRYARSPTLGLVFNEQHNDTEGPSNDQKSRNLSLQFNVPFYQGGAISSRVEESFLRHQAALEDAKQARRTTEREIRDSFLDVTSSVQRISALLQAVDASESAVEARQEGFAAGISTNLDVLDAQRDLFRARRDYFRARYDHIINLLTLERAAGSLEDENIGRINEWLTSGNASLLNQVNVDIVAEAVTPIDPAQRAPSTSARPSDNDKASAGASVQGIATPSQNAPRKTTSDEQTAKVEPITNPVTDPRVARADASGSDTISSILKDIRFQFLGSDRVRIDVDFEGPMVRSYSFGYLSEKELAVDFYDVTASPSVIKKKMTADSLLLMPSASRLLKEVRTEQQGNHTQVVFQLNHAVQFDNTTYNGGVAIVLRPSETSSPLVKHMTTEN